MDTEPRPDLLTPTDEFDRLRERRRERVQARLGGLAAWSVALQFLWLFLLCGAIDGIGRDEWAVLASLALIASVWLALLAVAAGAAWLALYHRDVLPIGWVLLGLGPAAAIAGELLLVLLPFVLRI